MDNNQPRNLPEPKNEIVVYQPDDTIRLAVRLENETVWLTQAQLCELFQRDVSVISRHIKNIFSECELDKESNLHYLQIATSDRPVALYSLDVIISVGYRVKSVIGTRFRQWANRILKEYVLRGYAVNEAFHDRFLIIDDKDVYLIGASLKDFGRKCFAFMKLDSGEIPRIKKTAFAAP